MSPRSALLHSPRPMLVTDSEDSRWQHRQKSLLRCKRFFFWFGHTSTFNLSFLVFQIPFPSLCNHPTYQKKLMIKEVYSATLAVKVHMYSESQMDQQAKNSRCGSGTNEPRQTAPDTALSSQFLWDCLGYTYEISPSTMKGEHPVWATVPLCISSLLDR
jgi:hypothetical protein